MGKLILFPSSSASTREARQFIDLVVGRPGESEIRSNSLNFEYEISTATDTVRSKATLTEFGRSYLKFMSTFPVTAAKGKERVNRP